MKRASYRDAISFIALNDDPGIMDMAEIKGMCSCILVSEIFGVTTEKVAFDVYKYRLKDKEVIDAYNKLKKA